MDEYTYICYEVNSPVIIIINRWLHNISRKNILSLVIHNYQLTYISFSEIMYNDGKHTCLHKSKAGLNAVRLQHKIEATVTL
jgi:hypothetical protein